MSDTFFWIQGPRHASPLGTLTGTTDAMGTSYALVREWWRRYRSRLELASYWHDQRKDLGFSADVDAKSQSRFGRSDNPRNTTRRA